MSFRPTISIYLNKRIMDCGYYRNWEERDIMLECCHLAKLLDGCRTRSEIATRLGRTSGLEEWRQDKKRRLRIPNSFHAEDCELYMSRFVERLRPLSTPASFCADEDMLLSMEANSEFPTFIDLTDRCLYWSRNGFMKHPGGDPVRGIREYEDALQYCDGWLYGGRISFGLIPHIERKLGGSRLDGCAHANEAERRIALIATTVTGAFNRSA